MIQLAFTTRLPLAVMIAMGIKQWENRNAMPVPSVGRCAMSVSKSSTQAEYANFLAWANAVFPMEIAGQLPAWNQVAHWRGNLVAACDFQASLEPGSPLWNEGYPVWWHLTNVQMLETPIPCQGNVGMWQLPSEIHLG